MPTFGTGYRLVRLWLYTIVAFPMILSAQDHHTDLKVPRVDSTNEIADAYEIPVDVTDQTLRPTYRLGTNQRALIRLTNVNPFGAAYRITIRRKEYKDSAFSVLLNSLGLSIAKAAASGSPVVTPEEVPPPAIGLFNAANCRPYRANIQAATDLKTQSTELTSIYEADTAFIRRSDLMADIGKVDASETNVRRRLDEAQSELGISISKAAMRPSHRDSLASIYIVLMKDKTALQGNGKSLPWECTSWIGLNQAITQKTALLNVAAAQDANDSLDRYVRYPLLESAASAIGDSSKYQIGNESPGVYGSPAFAHLLAEGNFDNPTIVDITIARRPLGGIPSIGAGLRLGAIDAKKAQPVKTPSKTPAKSATPALATDSSKGASVADSGARFDSTSADTTDSLGNGWRTTQIIHLRFGDPKAINVAAGVVFGFSSATIRQYTAVLRTPGDTALTIVRTQAVQPMAPMVFVSGRMPGQEDRFIQFNGLLGVAPSIQGQGASLALFCGLGVSFLGGRVGIALGGLNYPRTTLAGGLAEGDKLPSATSTVPTISDRGWAFSAGLYVTPF